MSAGILADLGDYYPGSRERRQVNSVPAEEEPDLGKGRMLKVRGVDVEFFGIGTLARVLNRKPVTIRAWENEGVIPTSGWTKPGLDKDPRGKRRLWTRAQIVGIWRIARDEGVLEPGPRVSIHATRFTERVTALFEQLREEGIR